MCLVSQSAIFNLIKFIITILVFNYLIICSQPKILETHGILILKIIRRYFRKSGSKKIDVNEFR